MLSDHHHFSWHKALHDRMSKIYVFQAMIIFIKSLIGIFIPVYLYSRGFSISMVFAFVIGISVTFLLFIPVSVKVIKRIGFKYSLLFSMPFFFLSIFFLNYVNDSYWYFHAVWFFMGIYSSIYWPAFHSEVALNGTRKNRVSEIGTLQVITILFATVAPFVGGLILEEYDYFVLFIFSTILLILGFIPLLLARDIKLKKYDFRYVDYLNFFRNGAFLDSKKAFACEGVEGALSLTLWPIILYVLLKNNFLNLGLLFTFVSVLSALFILYLKKFFDRRDKHKLVVMTTRFLSVNWFLRGLIFLLGGVFLYFIESFMKITESVFKLSFFPIFYNNAKRIGYMNYIIMRELYIQTTKVIFSLIIILLFAYLKESVITFGFVILSGAIFSLGLSYLKDE